MNKSNLDSELNNHLDKAISSRKVSLEDTKQKAASLWNIICNNQSYYLSKKVIVHHYPTGKVVTTMYSKKDLSNCSDTDLDSCIDEEFEQSCNDENLLEILCNLAENSDVRGKCRLCRTGSNKELVLDFK